MSAYFYATNKQNEGLQKTKGLILAYDTVIAGFTCPEALKEPKKVVNWSKTNGPLPIFRGGPS